MVCHFHNSSWLSGPPCTVTEEKLTSANSSSFFKWTATKLTACRAWRSSLSCNLSPTSVFPGPCHCKAFQSVFRDRLVSSICLQYPSFQVLATATFQSVFRDRLVSSTCLRHHPVIIFASRPIVHHIQRQRLRHDRRVTSFPVCGPDIRRFPPVVCVGCRVCDPRVDCTSVFEWEVDEAASRERDDGRTTACGWCAEYESYSELPSLCWQ